MAQLNCADGFQTYTFNTEELLTPVQECEHFHNSIYGEQIIDALDHKSHITLAISSREHVHKESDSN